MIVETKQEFNQFLDEFKKNDVIIIPILCDKNRNILNNELCFLFIKILKQNIYYILPFNHSETINLNIKILKYLKDTTNKKYVFDKKEFLNICDFNNLIDINLLYYLKYNNHLSIKQKYSNAEIFIVNKNIDEENIYKSVPILKLKERLIHLSNELEKSILENLDSESEPAFELLNNDTIVNLHKIEKNGIYVDAVKLLKFFPNYKTHIDKNGFIYSQYNIYTLTGRPSNRFGNLNFSALKKNNGEREFIISRFNEDGFLLYFDYEAYHLNLIANLINYKFDSSISIHEYLGRQYFNKNVLTEDEYNKSKTLSFEFLYGGIDDSIAEAIPFFKKVKEFINSMWIEYNKNGYIESSLFKKKINGKNILNLNSNKLFNYFLQNLETEKNILIIKKINKLLENYDTKLIMYLYDGFLFDYKKSDGKDLLFKIKNILIENGNFKTKQYIGKNFGELTKID